MDISVWVIEELGPYEMTLEGGSRSIISLAIQEESRNLISDTCLIHFLSSLLTFLSMNYFFFLTICASL